MRSVPNQPRTRQSNELRREKIARTAESMQNGMALRLELPIECQLIAIRCIR